MKKFKKNHELIRQNEKNVKSSQKHDVNLQKNSTLYFQIGLIMCLLAAYGVIEMKFLDAPTKLDTAVVFDVEPDIIEIKDFRIYQEQTAEKVVKTEPKVNRVTDVIKIDNTNEGKDLPDVFTPDSEPETPVGNPDLPVIEMPIDNDVPFIAVENAPIFPGCENIPSKDGKKECFEDKMTRFVNKKFNTDLAYDLGLKGIQKIYVQFTINKSGIVENIKVRAPHKALEKEAFRVVNKLPVMTPGFQREVPVNVTYMLPITFRVLN